MSDDLIKTLRDYLIADATVQALVSGRVYPNKLLQNSPTPALVVNYVSGESMVGTDGPFGLANPVLQIDHYATSYSDVGSLFDAVRLRLNGQSTGTIQGIFLVRRRDLPYDEDAKLYRRTADYQFWHEEST